MLIDGAKLCLFEPLQVQVELLAELKVNLATDLQIDVAFHRPSSFEADIAIGDLDE